MLALFAIGSVSKYAHTVYMIEIMSYDAQRRFMVKVCLMLKIWMFEMLTDEKESYQGQGWLLHSIKPRKLKPFKGQLQYTDGDQSRNLNSNYECK